MFAYSIAYAEQVRAIIFTETWFNASISSWELGLAYFAVYR